MKATNKIDLRQSIDDHSAAVAELAKFERSLKELDTRKKEIETAIFDLREKAGQTPDLATLTLDQVKLLSGDKSRLRSEISGLESTLNAVVKQRNDLERDRMGYQLSVSAAKSNCWNMLHRQLLDSVPCELMTALAATSVMAGKYRDQWIGELIPESLNFETTAQLAEMHGLPL